MLEISWLAEELFASQDGFCYVELAESDIILNSFAHISCGEMQAVGWELTWKYFRTQKVDALRCPGTVPGILSLDILNFIFFWPYIFV